MSCALPVSCSAGKPLLPSLSTHAFFPMSAHARLYLRHAIVPIVGCSEEAASAVVVGEHEQFFAAGLHQHLCPCRPRECCAHECVCVCMCVCVREKERQIDRESARERESLCVSVCVCMSVPVPFFDGYCSTVQGLLDWFEVDLGFTKLSFIQIDLCVLCIFVLYSRVSLSSCPFWTFRTASPARWDCL